MDSFLDTRLPQIPMCKGCEINPSLVGDYSMGHSIFCSEHCRRYFLGIGYKPIRLLIEERQRMAKANSTPYRRRRKVDKRDVMLVSKQEHGAIWDGLRRYRGTEMDTAMRALWLSALGYCEKTVARELGIDTSDVANLLKQYGKDGLYGLA